MQIDSLSEELEWELCTGQPRAKHLRRIIEKHGKRKVAKHFFECPSMARAAASNEYKT